MKKQWFKVFRNSLLLVAMLPVVACSQQNSTAPTEKHPRWVYFPNFVVDFPKGFSLDLATSTPWPGNGALNFTTTWPEFGSIPPEESLAIMREPDMRKNRRMFVFIDTYFDVKPELRYAFYADVVKQYESFPDVEKLDIVPGLSGLGRSEEWLNERIAEENKYLPNEYLSLGEFPGEADLFYSRAPEGHVERIILCTARISGPPSDYYSKWWLPRCTHRFILSDLAVRIKVLYNRRFVKDWKKIEDSIAALIRDNVVHGATPSGAAAPKPEKTN
ncbi:MAG TPA: hypothetical protein VJ654_06645 [Noviherbaspirillum sp.]|nr:hypothetical protein [Noviherbaspirillum sp.]